MSINVQYSVLSNCFIIALIQLCSSIKPFEIKIIVAVIIRSLRMAPDVVRPVVSSKSFDGNRPKGHSFAVVKLVL